MLEIDTIVDDGSDWGSDFDDEIIEAEDETNIKVADSPANSTVGSSSSTNDGELYEIPDGKPPISMNKPTKTGIVPEWLRKVEQHHQDQNHSNTNSPSPTTDENLKPYPTVYIENVILPTRASKDEDSKNFIETLKKKLSQKNLLVGNGLGLQINNNLKNSNNNNNASKTMKHLKLQQQQHIIQAPTKAQQSQIPDLDPEKIKKIKDSLNKYPWFYKVDRSKAELILENYNSDGSFLVRECHHGGPATPFTLTIRYGQRLFHIQIRVRPDMEFALGTSKQNEMHFSTVQDMIDTYRKTPLQLHTNGKFFGETKLTTPPIVYSFA